MNKNTESLEFILKRIPRISGGSSLVSITETVREQIESGKVNKEKLIEAKDLLARIPQPTAGRHQLVSEINDEIDKLTKSKKDKTNAIIEAAVNSDKTKEELEKNEKLSGIVVNLTINKENDELKNKEDDKKEIEVIETETEIEGAKSGEDVQKTGEEGDSKRSEYDENGSEDSETRIEISTEEDKSGEDDNETSKEHSNEESEISAKVLGVKKPLTKNFISKNSKLVKDLNLKLGDVVFLNDENKISSVFYKDQEESLVLEVPLEFKK